MDIDTDDDVRALLARGDPTALELLYDRHGARLYAYALGLVGTSGADDVIQELFTEVASHRRRVAQATNLPAYLTTMVRNIALRWRRQHPPVQNAMGEPIDRAAPARNGDDAAAERVRSAVASLPPALAEVVVLHAWEGQTFASIACRLGLAASTVGERWQVALATLRRLLPAEDDHE